LFIPHELAVTKYVVLGIPLASIIWLVYQALKKSLSAPQIKGLVRVGVYVVLIVAISALFMVNQKVARSRGETLIAACESYKQVYGNYPDKLEELVPEFVDEMPLSRYSLGFNKFRYRSLEPREPNPAFNDSPCGPDKGIPPEGRHVLEYTDVPPFGRPYYLFESGEWRYMD
jgi:hypothetical protein